MIYELESYDQLTRGKARKGRNKKTTARVVWLAKWWHPSRRP